MKNCCFNLKQCSIFFYLVQYIQLYNFQKNMGKLTGLIHDTRNRGYQPYKFQKEWCNNDLFKKWLKPTSDSQSVYCTVCRVYLLAKKSILSKHAQTRDHIDMVEIFESGNTKLTRRQKVLRAEIKLAAMIVARHVPFLLCDYLTPLLQLLFAQESEAIKNMALCRKKVANIIKYIMAPAQIKRLTSILTRKWFSIVIDESTDRSTASLMGIEVRYEDEDAEQIIDSFWDLITVYKDENAQQIRAACFL